MLFGFLQNIAYMYLPYGGVLPDIHLEDTNVAMEKWAEYDRVNSLEGMEVLDPEKFPWVKQFPPLTDSDPKPVIRTASVILAAHSEHKYLERTIDSILNSTAADQLVQIIVVDDASDPPLQEIVDKMPKSHTDKVLVIRHETREGLIRSKSQGAAAATGDIIVFLDAHVKPEPSWLPPLLKHTNENYKRVVVPLIPILNGETWTVDSNAVGIKMMFDWGLGFNWFDDKNDWVPIMSGGLLAITRRYWHESGEYDNSMLMWGGENIEQSVRIWLCGGEIVVARDSRISHVFRPSFPYAINHTQVTMNKVRTVEVWFDEYKEFFYRSDPFARTLKDSIGDTTEREELKKRLHCKPFQYFVDRFRAIFETKYMLPKDHFAIRDEITGKCLMASKDGDISLGDCDSAAGEYFKSEYRFVLDIPTNKGHRGDGRVSSLRYSTCFDANGAKAEKDGLKIILYACMTQNQHQMGWKVDNGGITWKGQYCAHEGPHGHLVFGACSDKQDPGAGEFLGKTFFGHPKHRFVIFDKQKMEVAKNDAEAKQRRDEKDA
jgi:glycosyltransferase involved in cell wall biosynthesis